MSLRYLRFILLVLATLHRLKYLVLQALRRTRLRTFPLIARALGILGRVTDGRRRWRRRLVLPDNALQHVDHVLNRTDLALDLGL